MSRYIGSILILIGAAIGAGMLALPMVSASAGFWPAATLLVIVWAIMTVTALLTLEVCLAFKPLRNSFGTMARKTLGVPGKVVVWIAYSLLLYATTASYIAGSTSLLDELLMNCFHVDLPPWLDSVMFTVVLGGMVFWSMRTVDYFVRFLLSIKGVLLAIALTMLMPHIRFDNLIFQAGRINYLWMAAPIFLNAFGFHFVIPSVCTYCDKKVVALKRVIIASTTIPLIIYLLWLLVSLGIIPLFGTVSFADIAEHRTSVGGFVMSLGELSNSKTLFFIINVFSNIAMVTSFLGVTLGLFDFLADGFKRKNNLSGRFQTALMTFVPPLAFALFYPDGFIMALLYSTFFAIILELFLPGLMVYRLRRSNELKSPYRFPMNATVMAVVLVAIGLALMGVIVAEQLKLLPRLI